MLRITTEQLLKKSKDIKQNMSIATLSQCTLSNTHNKLKHRTTTCNAIWPENSSQFKHLVNYTAYRKFRRSSLLQHDIKCVTTSYYEDLGIQSTASSKEIKEAFYKLSKECHPDKVGSENIEALQQFQAISEAYAVLSDPKLRRKYDRGVLGRLSSAADREVSKHKVDGDAFIQGRAAFREEFSDSSKRLSRTERLDQFVVSTTRQKFLNSQLEKKEKSAASPNSIDEAGKSVVDWGRPERLSRKSQVGHSYSDWTDGRNDKESSGGPVVFVVLLIIMIVIVRKLM